jgi:hypothetical protein
MSDSLVLKPATPNAVAVKSAPRAGFVAMFKAALESLVAAQSQRFEGTEPLSYRFPPI